MSTNLDKFPENLVVNKYPTNAIWASLSDFTYTYYTGTNGIIWFNSGGGSLTGQKAGIATYRATHKVTGRTYNFTIYVDGYTYELVHSFGFSPEVSLLIRDLYDKVDNIFSNESNLQRAWKCSRLLGGIVYGNDSSSLKEKFEWRNVAGQVFTSTEKEYFMNILGYSETQYNQLQTAIGDQYSDTSTPDFAHYQISLSARLAYQLDLDGFASNIGTFCSDEDVSYLAGWLGDATLLNNGTTSFGNDDYCSDLDAENTFRYILSGYSSVNAISDYFCSFSGTTNRATIFLNYISYDVVCDKVFYELIDADIITLMSFASQQGDIVTVNIYRNLLNDEEYHWDTIQNSYPDTYDFLISLQNKLANLGGY